MQNNLTFLLKSKITLLFLLGCTSAVKRQTYQEEKKSTFLTVCSVAKIKKI
jgi:hypothetical protein